MKLDREAKHPFMFQEFWASHYPLVQALSTFPSLELMTTAHTAHPRYTSGWASSAKVELGSWWKQPRGDKGQVPELLFDTREAMDHRAAVRGQDLTIRLDLY
jgi:cephalosporin-C deacetylase-like acetyl esterase